MLELSPLLKNHIGSLTGTSFAWLGVVVANQQQLEFWLKVVSLCFAIVASAVTVWGVLRRDRRDREAASVARESDAK
jgi:hypothetical protein